MSGLKRVEDQKMEMKKSSSSSSLDPAQTASKDVSEQLGGGKNPDRNGNRSVERNSSDKKVRKDFPQLNGKYNSEMLDLYDIFDLS